MKTTISIALVCFCISTNLKCQNLFWARSLPGQELNTAQGIQSDAAGHFCLTGNFRNTINLDTKGPGFNLISDNGSRDAFISKYDGNTNFLWGFAIGGKSSDGTGRNRVAIDNYNEIVIAGTFRDTVDFDPGSGSSLLINPIGAIATDDIFFAKYNSSGDLVWARSIHGNSWVNPGGLSIDADANIYIYGKFRDTVDLDPGSGVASFVSEGGSDGFIAKYSRSGNFIWGKHLKSPDNVTVSAITTYNNDVFAIGNYRDTIQFLGHKPDSTVLSSTGTFIMKFDSTGSFYWIKNIELTQPDILAPRDIHIDNTGNTLIIGEFTATVDFDPGSSTANITSNGYSDAFVLKLNPQGVFSWVVRFGGTTLDWGRSLATDNMNTIYCAGDFQNTVDFDPDPNSQAFLTGSNVGSTYLTLLDSSGNYLCAGAIGGNLQTSVAGIDLDKDQNILMTGYFKGIMDADPGSATSNLYALAEFDPWFGKYSKCQNIGLDENPLSAKSLLYPNPTDGILKLDLNTDNVSNHKISDVMGRLMNFDLVNNKTLNVESLPSGVYILTLEINGQNLSYRFVKR